MWLILLKVNCFNLDMSENLQYVLNGYQEFRQKYFAGGDDLYLELKKGQKPKVLVIACSDSRVDPAIILNCKPGDLFVVRNVANLVPPYNNDGGHHGTSAALEFGITGLNIKHIIILGHSYCGGIRALVEGRYNSGRPESFIDKWMEIARPSMLETIDKFPHESVENQVTHCSKSALIKSLSNLLTFPWIKKRSEGNDLTIRSWYFNIDDGMIEEFDEKDQEFKALKVEEA
jgi:carbonic anhydrase